MQTAPSTREAPKIAIVSSRDIEAYYYRAHRSARPPEPHRSACDRGASSGAGARVSRVSVIASASTSSDLEHNATEGRVTAVPLVERRAPPGRFSVKTIALAAAVAGVMAVALLTWAFLETLRSDGYGGTVVPESTAGARQAIALLSKSGTEQIPVAGSAGRIVLVVGPAGGAALLLDRPESAPDGSSFQAWVLGPNGEAAVPAAVFTGTELAIPLRARVPPGARVAVTVEADGGAETLAGTPRLVARRSP